MTEKNQADPNVKFGMHLWFERAPTCGNFRDGAR